MNQGHTKRGASRRILSVVGARPQFVKAAAVSRAIAERGDLLEVMVHTGQHYDHGMSEVFFDELDIPPPKHNLQIGGGGHADMTGRMLAALESVMHAEEPDLVLVYGDTNSTLAGALAAAKIHIPVAHVEAGLRSFNRRMPEEVNRVLTDHLSSMLFCPTSTSVENLVAEGIRDGVEHVGDVMYDASLFAAARAAEQSRILHTLGLKKKEYQVATVHRPENTDDGDALRDVVCFLQSMRQDLPMILPLHPRTRAASERFGICFEGLHVIAPLSYLDMTELVRFSAGVYTDSGGLQKEAYFHGVTCVTLRGETEWVETIQHGWNRLWSVSTYQTRSPIHEYGNGDASRRIVARLESALA